MNQSNSLLGWALGCSAAFVPLTHPAYSLQGAPTIYDASDELFVPDDHVPLSAFVEDSSGTVELAVDPDILSRITAINNALNPPEQLANPVRVAIWNGTSVTVGTPSVDYATGIVTFNHAFVGGRTFVVISPFFQNHFMPGSENPANDKSAIVTHWSWQLDSPAPPGATGIVQNRGGQDLGENDAFVIRDWAGSFIEECFEGVPIQKEGTSPDVVRSWKNAKSWGDATGYYYWASDESAVFSDGSGVPDSEAVPGEERFVGENYEPMGFTQLACVWLSDRTRQRTGFPVMHRNNPFAFDTGSPSEERIMEEAPFFQVAHAWEVQYEDSNVPGHERSLATFLLPPGWVSNPGEDRYPVLFNGAYGVNAATFGTAGRRALAVMGDLIREDSDHKAIGILWNGGGDGACQTVHQSAYGNMEQLMEDAVAELAIERTRVLATGGSRGGSTALAFAGNPYSDYYKVRFVIANSAQTDMADTLNHIDSTYDLVQEVSETVTGYLGSWLPGWTGPGPDNFTAKQLSMLNLFGTTDEDAVKRESPVGLGNGGPDDDKQLEKLQERGTSVVFRLGTHDHSRPFGQAPRYVERLAEYSIPFLAEYSYRFGHGFAVGNQPDELALMRKLFGPEQDIALDMGDVDQTRYYRRDPNSPCKDDVKTYYQAPEEFLLESANGLPIAVPLVVEAPIDHYQGAEATIHVAGQAGLLYVVGVAEVLTDPWYMNVGLFGLGVGSDFYALGAGTLPSAGGANVYKSASHTLTNQIPIALIGKKFLMVAAYNFEGSSNTFLAVEDTAARPYWQISPGNAVKVTEPGIEYQSGLLKRGTNVKTVTGGLSEDSEDYYPSAQ